MITPEPAFSIPSRMHPPGHPVRRRRPTSVMSAPPAGERSILTRVPTGPACRTGANAGRTSPVPYSLAFHYMRSGRIAGRSDPCPQPPACRAGQDALPPPQAVRLSPQAARLSLRPHGSPSGRAALPQAARLSLRPHGSPSGRTALSASRTAHLEPHGSLLMPQASGSCLTAHSSLQASCHTAFASRLTPHASRLTPHFKPHAILLTPHTPHALLPPLQIPPAASWRLPLPARPAPAKLRGSSQPLPPRPGQAYIPQEI
jgi:hypothetical protein